MAAGRAGDPFFGRVQLGGGEHPHLTGDEPGHQAYELVHPREVGHDREALPCWAPEDPELDVSLQRLQHRTRLLPEVVQHHQDTQGSAAVPDLPQDRQHGDRVVLTGQVARDPSAERVLGLPGPTMPDSRVRGSGPRAVFGGTFGTLCRTASSSDDGEVIMSGKPRCQS